MVASFWEWDWSMLKSLCSTVNTVARGYRSNDEGIAQLAALLGPGVEVVTVPLPHYRGTDDVFHLMSIISPLDADLALVHSPLMPVPFREWLLARGIELVEVVEEELDSLGCNMSKNSAGVLNRFSGLRSIARRTAWSIVSDSVHPAPLRVGVGCE